MATWQDVERVALTLPGSTLGEAHEGSPAVLVRTQQFARLRRDDTRGEVLQFWVADEDLVEAHVEADPEHYWSARGYSRKVVMVTLARLDDERLREHLVESWRSRASVSLRKAHPDLA